MQPVCWLLPLSVFAIHRIVFLFSLLLKKMLKQETIFCVFAMHRIFSYTRLCLHAEFSPVQNFTTAMWDRWVDHHRKLLHWSTDMCELNSCWLFFSETLNVHTIKWCKLVEVWDLYHSLTFHPFSFTWITRCDWPNGLMRTQVV